MVFVCIIFIISIIKLLINMALVPFLQYVQPKCTYTRIVLSPRLIPRTHWKGSGE